MQCLIRPRLTIGEFLEQNKNVYSIMIGGLKRTGLMDTLTNLTDWRGTRIRVTLFAETDEVLKAAGIQDFNSMPMEELEALDAVSYYSRRQLQRQLQPAETGLSPPECDRSTGTALCCALTITTTSM